MKNIKLITLDLTGTVFRFKHPPFSKYHQVAANLGVESDIQAIQTGFYKAWKVKNKEQPHFGSLEKEKNSRSWWYDLVHQTMKDALGSKYSHEAIEPIAQQVYEYYATPSPYEVYPDAKKFLSQGLQDQYKLGALTNFDRRIYQILKDLNLYNSFHFITCSEDARTSKPNPKIFKVALKQSGLDEQINPQSILHIGDDLENDYFAAKSIGWTTLLLDREKKILNVSGVESQDIVEDFNEVLSKINNN